MTTEEYILFREVGKNLNNKILNAKPNIKNDIDLTAKILKVKKNGQIDIESDNDTDFFFDFLIYEKISRGMTVLEYFYQNGTDLIELEEEILEGQINSFSSLFEISNIVTEKHEVTLTDILNAKSPNYQLMDLNFSKMAKTNMLIYTRLIPLRDTYISSGVNFVFNINSKEVILKQLEMKNLLNDMDKRIYFNEVNKIIGNKVINAEVTK